MNAPRSRVLDSVIDLLDAHGITMEELESRLAGRDGVGVTLGEFLDDELAKLTFNTRRTYATPLQRLADGAGPHCECDCAQCCDITDGCDCECRKCRTSKVLLEPLRDAPLTSITFRQLEAAVIIARRVAHKRGTQENRRRAARGRAAKAVHGKGAAETAVNAYRWLFLRARLVGHIQSDPAVDLKIPRRSDTRRRALAPNEFEPFFDAVAGGGDDPELDTLLCWFHAETGARREGGVGLTCGTLHDARQMIRLSEKFELERDQPVSSELIAALRAHAIERGGPRCDPTSPSYDLESPVFWYRARGSQPCRPLTGRRYDTLFQRVQATLPWADQVAFTAHGLRHTAGTLVERLAGTQVARRFLGHADRTVTDTYTDASEAEVAAAVARLTGQPHPLVPAPDALSDTPIRQQDGNPGVS